ncbi:MAG: hypothetical protein WCR45_03885 [Bacteroidaceae bacterium]|nr:hypothetical protein [Bacteroidaceae bacterium]
MNSKRKDLEYAAFFLIAVISTFLMGKDDAFHVVSWSSFICYFLLLFISGDCLISTMLRVKHSEEGFARWSTFFAFLVFSFVFMGDLFLIGSYLFEKLG